MYTFPEKPVFNARKKKRKLKKIVLLNQKQKNEIDENERENKCTMKNYSHTLKTKRPSAQNEIRAKLAIWPRGIIQIADLKKIAILHNTHDDDGNNHRKPSIHAFTLFLMNPPI